MQTYPTILNHVLKLCTRSYDLMQPATIISPAGLKTFCADSRSCLLSRTRETNYWGRGGCDDDIIQVSLLQTFPSGHFIAALNINVSTFVNSIAL